MVPIAIGIGTSRPLRLVDYTFILPHVSCAMKKFTNKIIDMAKIYKSPTLIKASGNKEKTIEEFIGRVNSGNSEISIARMKSPEGWEEPGQCPEFDEYTIVLNGCLKVKTMDNEYLVEASQAILVNAKEWVQYSSPFAGGAKYIAVCLPAVSPDSVHRDNQ